MKTTIATLSAALLIGCGSPKQLFIKETVEELRPAQTNMVEMVSVSTNVISDVVTNAAGRQMVLSVTNRVATTNYHQVVIPPILFTNRAFSDTLNGGVKGAGRVASNLGVPFADAIAGGLVALGGVVFGFLNRRGKRRALAELEGEKQERSKVEQLKAVADDAVATLTLNIDNVLETARTVPGFTIEHESQVKRVLRQAQKLTGVHDMVEATRRSNRIENGKA